MYCKIVDVQVIEFPGDVVDAPEQVQLALEVLERVAVPAGRDVALGAHLPVIVVGETELPQVVHPVLGVLAPEQVHALAVGRSRAAAPRRRSVLGFLGVFEQHADFVFGDVVLVDRVQVVGALAVVAAEDDDALLAARRVVGTAEGVQLGQGLTLGLKQRPGVLAGTVGVYLVGGAHVAAESADQEDAVPAAHQRMLGARARQLALGLQLLPVVLLDAVVQVDAVEVSHHALQDLVASVHVQLLVEAAGSTVAPYRDVLADGLALFPPL